jgi:hypothetical protein
MTEQPVISGEAQERDDEEEQGIGGDAPPSHRRQGMTLQNYSFFILFLLIFLGFSIGGVFSTPS